MKYKIKIIVLRIKILRLRKWRGTILSLKLGYRRWRTFFFRKRRRINSMLRKSRNFWNNILVILRLFPRYSISCQSLIRLTRHLNREYISWREISKPYCKSLATMPISPIMKDQGNLQTQSNTTITRPMSAQCWRSRAS